MKTLEIRDEVKDIHIVGSKGRIVAIDNENSRAQVQWYDKPKTWAEFSSLEPTSIHPKGILRFNPEENIHSHSLWHAYCYDGEELFCCAYGSEKEISEEKAQRIVKCVNMHDELVSALREASRYVPSSGKLGNDPDGNFIYDNKTMSLIAKLLKQAEQK